MKYQTLNIKSDNLSFEAFFLFFANFSHLTKVNPKPTRVPPHTPPTPPPPPPRGVSSRPPCSYSTFPGFPNSGIRFRFRIVGFAHIPFSWRYIKSLLWVTISLCTSQFQLRPSPPPPHPGQLRGICTHRQSRGSGISLPKGYPRAFDTRGFWLEIQTKTIL